MLTVHLHHEQFHILQNPSSLGRDRKDSEILCKLMEGAGLLLNIHSLILFSGWSPAIPSVLQLYGPVSPMVNISIYISVCITSCSKHARVMQQCSLLRSKIS